MNTFSYEIDGKLYINLTNKCSNSCVFCVRSKPTYEGYELWIDHEPTIDEVIKSIDDLTKYKEVVFCGYGEPTYRIDEVCELGKYFKSQGKKTRLNTNGHGNRINNHDIVPMMKGCIDVVSISLNANTREEYEEICKCKYKEDGFDILLDFAKECVNGGLETVLSIVLGQGVNVEESQRLADSVGARLYARELIL